LIGAPVVVADPATIACQPGQVVIDGQCAVPPSAPANAPARDNGPMSGSTGDAGGHGH
jgi:hypothetical protein